MPSRSLTRTATDRSTAALGWVAIACRTYMPPAKVPDEAGVRPIGFEREPGSNPVARQRVGRLGSRRIVNQ
jgi:hypothetical protein